jgi:DnaJ-class molecular chaperone
MHLIEAVEILALDNNWTQEDLKKRYFTLAKEYHPDKNPSGSDHFKKIKEAYETLKNVESGGSNPFIDLVGLFKGIIRDREFTAKEYLLHKPKCIGTITITTPGYFVRDSTLMMRYPISLKESLIGIQKIYIDPLGEQHSINVKNIIHENHGYHLATIDLILVFTIEYPKRLPSSVVKQLKEIDF